MRSLSVYQIRSTSSTRPFNNRIYVSDKIAKVFLEKYSLQFPSEVIYIQKLYVDLEDSQFDFLKKWIKENMMVKEK